MEGADGEYMLRRGESMNVELASVAGHGILIRVFPPSFLALTAKGLCLLFWPNHRYATSYSASFSCLTLMRLHALCCTHFSYEISQRDVSCFFWAVVRFPYEMSCFCVYNFRVRFPYESSCFWLGNLLSRFPNEISCFLALMRFHEISLLYFTLFFRSPMRFPCEISCFLAVARFPYESSCFLAA